MKWADEYIKDLEHIGESTFRPQGNSMQPLIESNDLVKVQRRLFNLFQIGDIVLCKVKGKQYLHLITDASKSRETYEISNNKGKVNGWIRWTSIYGVCIEINGSRV